MLSNEAKIQTLQVSFNNSIIRPSDLSSIHGISLQSASNRLRRYCKQGLFTRKREGKEYAYFITERGISRLAYHLNRKTRETRQRDWIDKIVSETLFGGRAVPPGYVFGDGLERCRIVRHGAESTAGDVSFIDETEEESVDEFFSRLSRERCRVTS